MNEVLTYQRLIQILREWAKDHKMINAFGHGNITEFSTNTKAFPEDVVPEGWDEEDVPITTKYPFCFVTPFNISYYEDYTSYQLTIIFADILQQDNDNELTGISQQSLNAQDLIGYILKGYLADYIDLELPVQAIPFKERFNDYTCGVSLDIVMNVKGPINICDDIAPQS